MLMRKRKKNALMISHLKKTLFPSFILTKLPVLKTTRIHRLLTLCQKSQNVLYCKNIKSFEIAYDVLNHFTNRPRPAQNLSSQKNFKMKMIKIPLSIMSYKKNMMPCHGA